MIIKLASPRGFCAGVDRAILIVERALEIFGAPIYVRHEIVHNRYIVETLKDKGAIFVEELDEVPGGATVIFSAHGVSRQIHDEATERGLQVFDATCPLVTKVHLEVVRFAKRNYDVVLIGHAGHPEVEGTMGHFSTQARGQIHLVENVGDANTLNVSQPDKLAFVTQTTLSVDETRDIITALQARFPNIEAPKKDDICYATQNRQDAVKSLAEEVDVLLVIGSTNSSNSNRLREIAQSHGGIPAYLIDGAEDLDLTWLDSKETIGITAGASAPEVLVAQVIDKLKAAGARLASPTQTVDEKMVFALPKPLQ